MVSNELAISMLKLTNTQPGTCFKFNRRIENHEKNNEIHPAVCLIRKDDYWNVGGCDEDLVGNYGFTDPIFWHRATGKLHIEERHDLYLDYVPDGKSNITRDSSKNLLVFKNKIIKNTWSDNYIRFDWEKVI